MTVRLTELLRRRLETEGGDSLGRVRDLVVRLEGPRPAVVRLRVGERRRVHEVEARFAGGLGRGPLVVAGARPETARLGDDELLLDRHVLDAQIVDLAGKRVTRVGDVELDLDDGILTVRGVAVGPGSALRRLGLEWLARRCRTDRVDWGDVHLTSRRGHTLLLASPAAGLHRAGPEALSHLVAHLPHVRAREILAVVGSETARAVRRAPAARRRRFPFRWLRRRAP